jgi:hypothetical protein
VSGVVSVKFGDACLAYLADDVHLACNGNRFDCNHHSDHDHDRCRL